MEKNGTKDHKNVLEKSILSRSYGYFEEESCSSNGSNNFLQSVIANNYSNCAAKNILNNGEEYIDVDKVKHLNNDNFFHTAKNINSSKDSCIPNDLVYKLKDRKHYHYYHTISFSNSSSDSNFENGVKRFSCVDYDTRSNPSLPFKPHYLQEKFSCSSSVNPPIPPRLKNKEAVFQREHLTEEYFENICRKVDVSNGRLRENVDESQANTSSDSMFDHTASNPNFLTERVSQTANYHKSVVNDNQCAKQLIGIPDLTQNLKTLKSCGWYWGDMTWKDAELMLEQRPGEIGLFLLRDSQDPLHILAVTVRTDTDVIRHIRLEYTNGKFQLYDPNRGTSRGAANCVRHSNIITFIKLAMKHSRNGNFLYFVRPKNMGEAPIQIQLLYPISRFSCIKSLKHYCRFTIRNAVTYDDVNYLPIPQELKYYLQKSYYFDPNEDLHCAFKA